MRERETETPWSSADAWKSSKEPRKVATRGVWEQLVSPGGQTYYFNLESRQTTWNKPAEFEGIGANLTDVMRAPLPQDGADLDKFDAKSADGLVSDVLQMAWTSSDDEFVATSAADAQAEAGSAADAQAEAVPAASAANATVVCLCKKPCKGQRGLSGHWARLKHRAMSPCVAVEMIYDKRSFLAYLVFRSQADGLDVEPLLKLHLQKTWGQNLNFDFLDTPVWFSCRDKLWTDLCDAGSQIEGDLEADYKLRVDGYLADAEGPQ